MSPDQPSPTTTPLGEIPKASLIPNSRPTLWATRTWFLTFLCAVIAIVLTITSFRSQGPTIVIRFQDGHGLKPGDSLKYHGIEVGRVTSITLAREFENQKQPIEVAITLEPKATDLAREGSRFWIERPRLSLARISGVETALGAKFVGIVPGPKDSPRQSSFEGLETPPTIGETQGAEITITFREGHGIGIGDPLRYRGNTIGEVIGVDWENNLSGIKVKCRLLDGAQVLARTGTQFWIERPRVSALEVKGLDTLVGGRLIGVIPGPAEAEPLRDFVGMENAPLGERPEGALEILVEGNQRQGLEAGVPVTYRGVPVGQVISIGLANDAANVEARVWILPAYKALVRDNTRFWNSSGVDFSVGLFNGLKFRADTFSTVALGGLAFATPATPGKLVATGHRFSFASKAEQEWLDWAPRLPVGNALLPDGKSLPNPTRATLRWSEKSLAINWSHERSGWVLPLDNGTLLGPTNLFVPPANASADRPVILEFSGNQIQAKKEDIIQHGSLSILKLGTKPVPNSWPVERLRTPSTVEDGLVVADTVESAFLVANQRLWVEDNHWIIPAALSLGVDDHGACVISPKDGKLIGLLLTEKGKGKIAIWK